ncbi:FliH/SctL family protein [Breoghania sp. L-A4]|uniref:FliH/SctL family protein n=1 Tax=Breoghania sp. L-A4 TaxID=2304600 RepID=UPI000E35AF5A|nr:FliH/SctL family protein [Breoghania sp. L-A4]AXS41483.1 flagellar assembly protein FliH [Breoghania sp. L-A4]
MASRPTPERFLFNQELLAPKKPEKVEPEVAAEPTITVREHQKLLADAEKRGHQKGLAAGRAEVVDKEADRLAGEADRLTSSVDALLKGIEGEQERLEKDAVGLAFLAARRFAAHLIAREPLGEVVALLSECLGPLRRQPHVVVRINERDSDRLKNAVDGLVYEKGFEGRLVILGEPDLERGDCRIEWADGGLLRDRKALEKQIEALVRRYFTARDDVRKASARAAPASDTTGA